MMSSGDDRRLRELERIEALYRSLFESMLDGFADHEILYDERGEPCDYRFLMVNPAFERMTGLRADDIIGHTVMEVLPGIEKFWIETYGRVALTGEPAHFTQSSQELGRHFEVSAFRSGPGRFACLFLDVTARVEAELETRHATEQLRRSRAMLARTESMAHIGSWEWDVASDRVTWSDELYRIFQLDPAQPVSTYADQARLYPPDDFERLQRAVHAAISEGTSYDLELKALQRNGPPRDCRVQGFPEQADDGRVTRLHGFVQDITKHKEQDRRLEADRREWRWLVESMINAFVIFDSVYDDSGSFVSYRFVFINHAYEEITDVHLDEVRGKTVHEVWPDTEPSWIERYGQVAMTGVPQRFEMFHGPTDKTYDCRVYRPWDTPDRFCVVFEDVSDLREAQARLERLNEELEARVVERTAELVQANEELESFSYSVSHDLRAPLRAITGFAEIIARRHRAGLDDEGRHYIDNIVEAGGRMGGLIDDLLAYSRLGRRGVTLGPVEMATLLDEVVSDLGSKIEAAGARIEIATDPPVVVGSKTLLRQVFTNLLDNAITYVDAEGGPVVAVRWEETGDEAVVTVADNGVGIAEEHQHKIWDIFQRLHPRERYPGTGVGLAIARKAASLMHGTVGVESSCGVGSKFWVRLPLAARDSVNDPHLQGSGNPAGRPRNEEI